MATSQEATQATENNRKLFRRYGKMFALADPNVYTSHADKLSLWLSDFKAYYTSARPEVRTSIQPSFYAFYLTQKDCETAIGESYVRSYSYS